MFKKYFANPSFLFLLAGNLYCIWYYQNHPGGFTTVAWIYWLQSVIIGLFNFIIKKDGTVCPPFFNSR